MPRPIRVAAVWLAAFVLVLDVGTAAASAWGQLAAVVGSAALVAVVVGFLRASERDQFLSVAEDRLVRLFTIGSAAVAAATIIQLTQIGLTRPRAAVLVDLDGFKQINDSLGHRIGDAVLRRFGEALRGRTRSTDLGFRLREQDIAARYGGDDFAVVLPHTPKMGAAVLAERLRAMFDGTILHAESGAKVTLSIGVAAYPDDAEPREALIESADAALYGAKSGGRNRVVAFDRALSHASASRAAAAAAEGERLRALMQTIDERLVRCDYQPLVDVADWSLHGYEALCRPTDPQFAGPRALFQMAEAVGRVVPLGRTVREACTASIDALPEPARLFVNLHPHELHDRELLDGETRLRRYARRIVFELTESAEIQDYGRTRDALARLRSLGFRVALDDFGAGYAGLNLLAMLEPDYVKLDVAMVRSVRTNPRSARLVRHLLDFARGENMIVIADGIETVEELNAVRELGVRYMQGYYFARPEPGFVAPAGRPPG